MSPKKRLHRSIKAWYEGLSIEAQKHLSHWDIGALKKQALAAISGPEHETSPVAPEDWILRRNASDEPLVMTGCLGSDVADEDPEPERKASKRKTRVARIGKTQRNILRSMKVRQVYKTSEVAALVEVSPNTASKSLHKLLNVGLMKKVRHGYWKKPRD